MIKKIALLTVLLIAFTGCSNNSDAAKFKKDYESLNGKETETKGITYRSISIDSDNPIVYSSFKEVKEKVDNKETFIVYVGFAGCPWCRSVIPYILESAKENDIDKIYYVNVREDNTKESDLRGYYKLDEDNNVVVDVYPDKYYHDVLNTLSDYLEPFTLETEDGKTIETGENRLYAPSLIAYKNGKAIGLDECISDKQTNGYEKLTKKMISDMKSKATKVFKKIQ